jgi:hypothetical protein
MASGAPAPSVGQRLLQMQLIYAAVLAGAIFFLAYAYYTRGQVPPEQVKPQTQLTNVLIGVGLLCIALGWLAPGQIALTARMKIGRQILAAYGEGKEKVDPRALSGDDSFWASQYLTVFLVRLGLLEAGAIVMSLAHLLEGPPNPIQADQGALPFWAAIMFILAILMQFPTLTKLQYWTELQRAQVLRDHQPPSNPLDFLGKGTDL